MTPQGPSRDRIRDLLRERVVDRRRGVGGIIGVIAPSDAFTIACGHVAHGASAEITADTIFDLGCVSKVLTGLLCADMVEHGEIRLSDPVADYLPGDVPTVGSNGVAMTLEHLVTHRAGLPTWEVHPLAPLDRIYAFVREYVPRHDVGVHYEYSTVGFALLGEALARRAGSTHAALVRERVCAPLGMVDTWIEVPPAAASRVAVGHDAALIPVPPSTVPETTGGYGFYSTAADLMRLLSASVGQRTTALDAAIRRTRSIRRTGSPGVSDVAMAWHIGTVSGVEIFSHDGVSTGHRAFLGVVPELGRALVALLNGAAPIGLTDIARHVLHPDCPLLPDDFPLLRPARSAPPAPSGTPAALDDYVGTYQLTPRVRVEVLRDDAGLQLKGDSPTTQAIFPYGDDEFWLPASGPRLDCVVRFERAGERVAAMIVADPAGTRRLTRIDEPSSRVWHGRVASETGPVALDPYRGCYQFGEYVLEVRAAGQALCAVWSWAGRHPPTGTNALGVAGSGAPRALIHERDHRFIVDAEGIDVSLTFELDGSSHAPAVWCQIQEWVEYGARIPAMIG